MDTHVYAQARKQTAARQKRVEAPLERPEELLNTTGNKQETDKLMEIMFKVLHNLNKKGEGCPVVKLVLNRQSFAQTVENIFTLSFLVRRACNRDLTMLQCCGTQARNGSLPRCWGTRRYVWSSHTGRGLPTPAPRSTLSSGPVPLRLWIHLSLYVCVCVYVCVTDT